MQPACFIDKLRLLLLKVLPAGNIRSFDSGDYAKLRLI